jgi:histone H3/H4
LPFFVALFSRQKHHINNMTDDDKDDKDDDDDENTDNDHISTAELSEMRKALQHAVCKICLREDRNDNMRTTGAAMTALTELALQYVMNALVPDLYSFSSHANRKSTITTEDVAMVLRKLPSEQFQAFREEFCKSGRSSTGGAASTTNYHRRSTSPYRGGMRTSLPDTRKPSAAADTRRKRGGIDRDALSLSSSSDDNDILEPTTTIARKRNRSDTGKSATTSLHFAKNSTGASANNANSGNKNESLLSRFELPPVGDSDDDDSSSSLDIDPAPPPPARNSTTSETTHTKNQGTSRETSPSMPFALKRVQDNSGNNIAFKPPTPRLKSRGDYDSLLDDDDDIGLSSEDGGGGFMRSNTSASTALGKPTTQKSQVAEALENFSDSGMDRYDDENEEEDDDDDEENFFGKQDADKDKSKSSVPNYIRNSHRHALEDSEEDD